MANKDSCQTRRPIKMFNVYIPLLKMCKCKILIASAVALTGIIFAIKRAIFIQMLSYEHMNGKGPSTMYNFNLLTKELFSVVQQLLSDQQPCLLKS